MRQVKTTVRQSDAHGGALSVRGHEPWILAKAFQPAGGADKVQSIKGVLVAVAAMVALGSLLTNVIVDSSAQIQWPQVFAMALTIQTAVFVAVTMQIAKNLEKNQHFLRRFMKAQDHATMRNLKRGAKAAKVPQHMTARAPLRLPPPLPGAVGVATGRINGRLFVRYKDNSVELETLLGRRRFYSIEAAQDFVGGEAIYDTLVASQPVLLEAAPAL